MSLLHGHQIIDKEIMTELDLLQAAKTGKIVILDPDSLSKPISWEELIAPHKKTFQEICELAKKPGQHHARTGITYSAGVNSDGRREETRKPPRRTAGHDRLSRDDQKTDRIPDITLLSFLRDASKQTRIPAGQYDEIQRGWGATQEKRILLDAVFEIEEKGEETTELSYCESLNKIEIEKKGIGKTVHMHIDQLPAAFNLCAGLLIEYIDSEKLKEIQFTREFIIDLADNVGVKSTLARDIHENLPPVIKGERGKKSKKQP